MLYVIIIARERFETGEICPQIIPSKRAFHCSLGFFFTTYPHNPNITPLPTPAPAPSTQHLFVMPQQHTESLFALR